MSWIAHIVEMLRRKMARALLIGRVMEIRRQARSVVVRARADWKVEHVGP